MSMVKNKKMKEEPINSVKDFFAYILSLKPKKEHVLFRGVANSKKDKLKPKIGRIKNSSEIAGNEKFLNDWFKSRALPFLNDIPKNAWEWLALAQHHGLSTRMLDWTMNPLVAAFFAVEKKCNTDSAIYVYDLNRESILINPEDDNESPFNIRKDAMIYFPKHRTLRIPIQSAVFTVHKEPHKNFDKDNIEKLIIKNSIRDELKEKLDLLGINRQSLFPGLDTLAAHLNDTRGY